MTEPEFIARYLMNARVNAGIDRIELARRMGVRPATIHAREVTGIDSVKTILQMCEALDVDPVNLMRSVMLHVKMKERETQ